MSECSQELLWHLPCDVAEYLCSSVCQDLSCRNSCSGVELITGWVFWGELTTVHPPPPPPPCYITDYRALSKWQSAFVQPFEILVTFLSDAQPNNKGAFILWSRLGKDIDKTLVGKDLSLCQAVHAVDYQKESYFCFKFPDLVCLCMVVQGRFMLPFPCFEKEKDTICFHTQPLWLWFGPYYFWKDFNAGLCWDWVYIIVLPRSVAQWGG